MKDHFRSNRTLFPKLIKILLVTIQGCSPSLYETSLAEVFNSTQTTGGFGYHN